MNEKALYTLENNKIIEYIKSLKEDIYKEISHQYDEFLTSRIDSKKALLTLCIAYVEFAQEYKNLFILLNIRLLLSTLILNYIKHKVNIQICYICLNIFPICI